MKLLTKEIEKVIPKFYSQEMIEEDEKVVYVKYFTPWANWTWYAVEYNPEDKLFFGLVEGNEREWGYFSLEEMESIRGPFGLTVERDLFFKPTKIKDLKITF